MKKACPDTTAGGLEEDDVDETEELKPLDDLYSFPLLSMQILDTSKELVVTECEFVDCEDLLHATEGELESSEVGYESCLLPEHMHSVGLGRCAGRWCALRLCSLRSAIRAFT